MTSTRSPPRKLASDGETDEIGWNPVRDPVHINDLQATLLPHQMDRLRQIAAQSQLRRRNLVEILTSEPMKSRLEITDNQADELKDAEQEIREDLEKQIAKLREQARERLLSKLKPGQQKQVEEIFGEAFEFQQAEYTKRSSKKSRK